MPETAISWAGLPQYAARLLHSFHQLYNKDIIILGTKPSVPVECMEEILGQKIYWIKEDQESLTWEKLGLTVPKIFVQSGWYVKPFVNLAAEVRSNGGAVIGLADNNYIGNLHQYFGAIRFRMLYKAKFDGMLVPGQSGLKLMRYYGMSDRKIRTGMYGSDPELFFSDSLLTYRPKTMLFVGQFIKRKGLLKLCEAFLKLSKIYPEWKLQLCGAGELKSLIPISQNIIVNDFIQPEQLSEIYRKSRFFILPSFQEHWGLVVHEAASSGCALLLSKAVGSIPDLAVEENSVIFDPNSNLNIFQALRSVVEWSDDRLLNAQKASLEMAKKFGPEKFARSLNELIELVSHERLIY
jgi:glycosyltransferase involved in cell wall biosynthesis